MECGEGFVTNMFCLQSPTSKLLHVHVHVHVIYFSVDLFTRYGNSHINNNKRNTAT
jgi:hypothetical protein